jgi:hypothetical protein
MATYCYLVSVHNLSLLYSDWHVMTIRLVLLGVPLLVNSDYAISGANHASHATTTASMVRPVVWLNNDHI